MSLTETENTSEEEIAKIQAKNNADYRLAEKLNRLESMETGLTGLENSASSSDVDTD